MKKKAASKQKKKVIEPIKDLFETCFKIIQHQAKGIEPIEKQIEELFLDLYITEKVFQPIK